MPDNLATLRARLAACEADNHELRVSVERHRRLIDDLHHRTKNNLQMIITFIEMKSRDITDSRAQERLREIKDRVLALGAVYNLIFPGEPPDGRFLQDLCEALRASYGANQVELVFDIEVDMTPETATPLGLLVTELLSNAFKHAFDGVPNPRVSISLRRVEGDTVRLVVADNGRGLPEPLPQHGRRVSGLRLVQAFAQELGGEIVFEHDGGAVATVTFRV